jgi:CubicO group peptidase (beta-lactamase class C family)
MLRGAVLGFLLVLGGAAGAHAQTLHPLPPQPEGVAWPTQEWAEAPLPGDVDQATVDLAATQILGVDPLMGETRAVVVVQDGRIVFERYGEGYSRDNRLVSWSMAKSVTQALVGAAVLQGGVSIDAPMGNPHWRASDRRSSIPWRLWLQMVDGQDYLEIGAPSILENDVTHMLYGRGRMDTAAFASSLPLVRDPGAHWNYNSAGTILVADALTRTIVPSPRDAEDRRNRMRIWMGQSLFDPIGMHPVVEFDPSGTFYGSALVYATARDFARFGYLYLRNGVWDGRRILPEGWVDFARAPGPDPNTDVYGAHWWLTPAHGSGRPQRALITADDMRDAFSAQGHEGQIIVVVPSKDLVLVRLGRFDGGGEAWNALGDWATLMIGAFGERPARQGAR